MAALALLNELNRHLDRWLRQFRLQRAVAWAGHGLIIGLAISLVLSLSAIFGGELLREEFLLIVTSVAIASMTVIAVVAYVWPTPRLTAARFFDRRFGLRERVSTALELAAAEQPSPTELIQKQLEDAVAASREIRPHAHLPVRVARREVVTTVLLVAGVLFVWLKGEAFFQAALQTRAVQQAIAQEVAQIEAIREQIEAHETLTAARGQRQALTGLLDETAQRLQDSQSLEQATSVLVSTEQQLEALIDPQAQDQAQGLQDGGNRLSQDEGSPLQQFGQNLAAGDTLAAAEALRNIDTSSLSPAETDALAQQLEAAAEALQATNPELAQQLRDAAEAIRSGDTQAAQAALEQAAQTLTQTGQRIIQSELAREAASLIGEGRQRVIQAGRGAQGSQGQSAQGGQSGQGQTGQSDQGNSGAGTGRGEGNADSGPSAEAGADPIDQNNGADDGGERGYEQIYAPERLGGSEGEDVTLPGSGDPGGEVVGEGNMSPGDEGRSTVPYVEVFAAYAQAFRQAIDSGQVPIHLRALIKEYFSSLEP